MIEFKPVHAEMGPFGHWSVDDKIFYVKRDALVYASRDPEAKIVYRYYDGLFRNFDRTKIGKLPLSTLYRTRAQQLREQYDHLTLYYSGGADSHNILMTFVNSGIKLDNVFVNWPKKTIGSSLYTPNTVDNSARNMLSEWDYSIKPTLDWLAANHPEVPIEVGDWSENIDEKYYVDDRFTDAAIYWGVGSLPRNQNVSRVSREEFDKGRRVASIFGMDKPCLFLHPDDVTVSMFFHDTAFQTATNCVGTFEPFYWTPYMPLLAYEMAYAMLQWYELHPDKRHYIRSHPMRTTREAMNEFNNELTRQICYPETWDGRFQSGKPYAGVRNDRDFWLFENPEFKRIVDRWRWTHTGFMQEIDSRFLDEKGGILPIRGILHHLGQFTQAHVDNSNI